MMPVAIFSVRFVVPGGLIACRVGADAAGRDSSAFAPHCETGRVGPGPSYACPPLETGASPQCDDPGVANVPAAPPGSPCTRHEDCVAEQFCGAGFCVIPEVASFTVCAEEAAVTGEVPTESGQEPVLRFFLGGRALEHDPFYVPYVYYPDCKYGAACVTAAAGGCRPQWDYCNRYNYSLLVDRGYSWNYWSVLEETGGSPGAKLASGSFDGPTLGRYVDEGCVELVPDGAGTGAVPSEGPPYEVRTWISVWYNPP